MTQDERHPMMALKSNFKIPSQILSELIENNYIAYLVVQPLLVLFLSFLKNMKMYFSHNLIIKAAMIS